MKSRRQWLLAGCGMIGLLLILRSHFCLTMAVGQSMWPTFNTGELLLVDKRAYQNADPLRGDIVIARHRKELIVKRIMGLPGEEVAVKNGVLYINNSSVIEDHAIEWGFLNIGKGKLFEGKFAILGDNRALPQARTVHAVVSKDQIVGKVVFSIRLWRRHSATDEET
jgi:signal peptidase I